MANTAIRRGDEQTPEQAVGKTITDRQLGPAARIFARGHAFNADERFLQAPQTAQSAFKRRLRKAGVAMAQRSAGMRKAR